MIKPCFDGLIAEHFPEFMLTNNRIYIDGRDMTFALIPDSFISPLFLSSGMETLDLLKTCSSICAISNDSEYMTMIIGPFGDAIRKSYWNVFRDPDFRRITPTSLKIYYGGQGEDALYPEMLADIYRISQEMED